MDGPEGSSISRCGCSSLLTRSLVPSCLYWSADRGSIPKCFIFDCNVVRFKPSRTAAPRNPPICPRVSRSARRMCSRSVASKVSSLIFSTAATDSNSASGDTRTEPCDSMTERSMKFSNSRTLPGQSHFMRASIILVGTLVMDLFIRRANFCTKCSTSNAMSSRRSRNGGTRIGNTFSR